MKALLGTVLIACLGWVLCGSAYSQTKIGGGTVAMQSGECRALLNGVDVGCPKGAVHNVLQNGRHLVNFAATDVATIGFAGARLEATGSASSVLWLDGAYINQQRFAADGQCVFEQRAADRIELKCSALLRDGRKLSAVLNSAEQTETFLGLNLPSKQKVDCEQLIELHGMLSRAQFQCNFSKYANSMLDDAKKCAAVIGQEAAKKQLQSGMELFDYNEQRRGHDAMCQSVLTNFPNFIRK